MVNNKALKKNLLLLISLAAVLLILPLIAGSGKGYLGVAVSEMTPSMLKRFDVSAASGLLVNSVTHDSPADRAGLMEDDVITGFNGEAVGELKAFTRMVRKVAPGNTVGIDIVRDSEKMSLKVELGKRKSSRGHFTFFDGQHGLIGGPRLGIEIYEPDKDLRGYFPGSEDGGVLVLKVLEDSPAEEAGLKSGDIITAIDDEKIIDREDLFEILADYDEGDEVTVTYRRKGKVATAQVNVKGDQRIEIFRHGEFAPKIKSFGRQFREMRRHSRHQTPRVIVEHLGETLDI